MENALSALLASYLDLAKSHIEGLKGVSEVGDAIHDFRLSMRRLRSWLKICREYDVANFSSKNRRRLKKLVRSTNESRDLDVHAKLLNEYIETLSLSVSTEAAGIVKDWNSQRTRSHRATTQDAFEIFQKVEPELRKFIAVIKAHEESQQLTLVSFVARVMSAVAKELDGHLDAIGSSEDIDTIHRARLLAKSLRYLGEPFAHSNISFALLVKELHVLQDVIGGLRDAQMFALRFGEKHKSSALKAICDRNRKPDLAIFFYLRSSLFKTARIPFRK